ncbi:hypothetical protein Zmor_008012 [Zophobas morio]|uniref:Laminin IV type A domain-containing protein n=1 Tax=Zophobas morio TaxID=2755281 RepID=A0AA38MMN7_9CUCU|nr:hypothetical protein Zmor_008012 [Zophobas morio]
MIHEIQDYSFRLHEHPNYGWQPRLSARAFMSILTNLTSIKIRATYSPRGVGFLDDVKLETAGRLVAGTPALWVEQCSCPPAYVGQFCESCAPGFRHSPIIAENEQLVTEIEEQLFVGHDQLDKGKSQEDDTNELLQEIYLYKTQAEAAVRMGNDILNSTKETYKILTHFDKQIQDSRSEAEKALQQIDDIQDIIDEASDKALQANKMLAEAKYNADQALVNAKNASGLAKNASINAEGLKNDADLLYQNATKLNEEAELMAGRVEATGGALKTLLQETKTNETLINHAKEKDYDDVSKNYDNVTREVEKVNKDVNNTFQETVKTKNKFEELQIPTNLVDNYLLELERKFNESIRYLKNNSETLKNLLKGAQDRWNDQLAKRAADVAKNISQIQDNLNKMNEELRNYERALNETGRYGLTVNDESRNLLEMLKNELEKLRNLFGSVNFTEEEKELLENNKDDERNIADVKRRRLLIKEYNLILDTLINGINVKEIRKQINTLKTTISLIEQWKRLESELFRLRANRDAILKINCTVSDGSTIIT